jgi:hypothetical protein
MLRLYLPPLCALSWPHARRWWPVWPRWRKPTILAAHESRLLLCVPCPLDVKLLIFAVGGATSSLVAVPPRQEIKISCSPPAHRLTQKEVATIKSLSCKLIWLGPVEYSLRLPGSRFIRLSQGIGKSFRLTCLPSCHRQILRVDTLEAQFGCTYQLGRFLTRHHHLWLLWWQPDPLLHTPPCVDSEDST